jgi:hypothetical protein
VSFPQHSWVGINLLPGFLCRKHEKLTPGAFRNIPG